MEKKKVTILVIDDAEEDQQLIQILLKKNPHYEYSIFSAYSGKEGFHLYDTHAKEIECILLYQQLADIDGFAVLSHFKAQEPSVPVIILTEKSSYADDLLALEKGAADYIHKDQVTPLELERAIRYAIDKQRIINELKSANQEKEHFLRVMSHDMKTPLASILGFSSIMANDKTTPLTEKQKKTLEKITQSVEYLNKIISDVMTTALIDKGKVRLNCEEFNIIDALYFCILLIKPKASSKNITINFSPHAKKIMFWGDKNKLTEAVENLLENAVKFTSSGTITIDVEQKKSITELRIRDTGIGMNSEQLSRIFTPFVQATETTQIHYGGLGLGLSIAKNFIQLHEGIIDVKSSPGDGTEFIIKFPNKGAAICHASP